MMARPIGFPRPSPPVITAASRNAINGAVNATTTTPGSGASPWSDAANTLLAFPFVLEATTTIYKGFAMLGASPGSNFEVGILDESYAKIVSSGTTAAGAVAAIAVMADFADTTLPPGLYYAGMSADATTTGRWLRWTLATVGIALWQGAGCWKMAAAGPGSFPTTATPGDITNVAFPCFGLITRSVFDV